MEIYGIRVVCATFGIHSFGHCCKFHLILCHIALALASAPTTTKHMHLTLSHLTCKIFNTQKFLLHSPPVSDPALVSQVSDRGQVPGPQRVKSKYSKLFLKCALRRLSSRRFADSSVCSTASPPGRPLAIPFCVLFA